jgi:hypothetical protein
LASLSRPSLALGVTASAVLLVTGCIGSSVPQLPVSVAAAISDASMRRLESADVVLYYPEARRDEAERFLARVDVCVAALRARALGRDGDGLARQKAVLIMPELPYNNAFVTPRRNGYEELAVVPTPITSDEFALENGVPPDPAAVACHEVTHFVQLQQIEGVARAWNDVFGLAYTPQTGLDSWFLEGLAVYYETRLVPGTGRLASPFWEGVFAAGVAGRRLGGGDLSAYNRDFYAGNQYLVGSRFVRFLAERYGEDKLWRLIDVQARSVLFPLAVNLRFGQVYGKSLSRLIDEFADDVRARTPVAARPPGQRTVRGAGWSARYARARDGTEALVVADRDEPTRLRIFAPDGTTLVDEELTDVLPPRTLVTSGPTVSGGLDFSPDGKALYFVTVDQDETYLASRLCRYDIPGGTFEVVVPDLGGPGGSLSADGRRYLFARAEGDHHDLAEVDLLTGTVRVLATETPGAFVAQPRVSPDGTRIVAMTFDGRRFGLALLDAATGRRLQALPTGALLVDDPSWVDDDRVVFLGSPSAEAGFQVYLLDLRDGRTTQLSHAPYLAFAPRASGRSVRFLNREGWSWTVDEIALPPRPAAAVVPVAAPTSAPASTADPALDVADATGPALSPFPQQPDAPPPGPLAAEPNAPAPPPAEPAPSFVPASLEPPAILSDEPARDFEGLLVPALRSPYYSTTGAGDVVFGASLTGADRLERHRWVLTGFYQPVVRAPSFELAYSNRQLAPVSLTLAASQVTERDDLGLASLDADAHVYATLRARTVSAQATRAYYGNPLSGGALVSDHLYTLSSSLPISPSPDAPLLVSSSRIRLGGVFASATYAGVQSTPYSGTRREFFAEARLAEYPANWGTFDANALDALAELVLTTPLPLSRRHTLTLIGVARALDLGDHTSPIVPYLRVGGLPSSLLWRHPGPGPVGLAELPDTVSFRVPLRGFEDHAIPTERVALAEAAYRYPFIIDLGSASTFGVLPSFFVRELDLELFASAAVTEQTFRFTELHHAAEGASLTVSTVFGAWPVTLGYQISRRLTDDHGVTQLLTLTD